MSEAGATVSRPSELQGLAKEPGRWRDYGVAGGFLAPALVLLGVWIVYPAVRTAIRSFFNADGTKFVWFKNYKSIFTSDFIVTAIKNNAIWVGVVPALVTAIGLVFAVLGERVRWSVAFKTAVFMPMAISLFAGDTALLGLTGIAPEAMPAGAKQAVVPAERPGTIVGVVWRDFKPGGGV